MTKEPQTANRKMAESIAQRLFTNGFNQTASRLVLELPDKRDGGGWCHSAVVDQIEDALNGKSQTAPECSHHMWFMGVDSMVCANCKIVIKPEPFDIGKWSRTMPTYNADTGEWTWIV